MTAARRFRLSRSIRGYLLLECLIALLLAASLIAALVALQLEVHRQGRTAADLVIGSRLAEHRLEALLAEVRAGIATGSGDDVWRITGTGMSVTDPDVDLPGHWRRWAVVPDTAPAAIEVTVAWPNPDPGPDRVVLTANAQTAAAADSGWAAAGAVLAIAPGGG